MSETRDGGPAFPCSNKQFTHGNPQTGDAWSGLSLRDYFAAQAMAAILRNYSTDSHSLCAANAYDIADEMLAARTPTS